jgi:PAS domain S-box-containing protein
MTTRPRAPVTVHGTRLLHSDPADVYRQKVARITLDSMVQFVGLLDAQGNVLEINKVALDAVGINLSEVEGRPFWTTFWWQVSEEINATLRDCIRRAAAGEFVRWDTPIYGRAGGKETIIIDASLMPVKDDSGKVVFIAAEGRDITEKKAYEREIARQREELAKLDELKTEFFANISHEFRTPLTLMLGPLEDALAEPERLDQSTRQRLELAHRNALRQFKLVNTLLDFSRIEAGRIQASYESTDLPQFTAELASIWRSAIERAGLQLVIDCQPYSQPAYVDREMWEKIVLNLLSNAFKFTFVGLIEVSLRQDGRAATLVVRDTGAGIPQEELPQLFERFHRVKGAKSRSYEGSGIGLSLIQELAKLHGGTIAVESEAGVGSRFVVSIPMGKNHLPADRIGAARTVASTVSGAQAYVEEALRWLPDAPRTSTFGSTQARGLPNAMSAPAGNDSPAARVLLVDDNADMRDYVCRMLQDAGYAVETAPDGLAALDTARARKPDLILSDVMMPGLDGFGLLREVRTIDGLRETPFIMLSARAGEDSRIQGIQSGADDYLTKPFGARELLAKVDAQLKLARFRHESTAALRESEKRFRALTLASSDAVYRMSPDWTEMRHLEGRKFIEDTLKPDNAWVDRYIHPDDREPVISRIREAIRTKTTFELEHRVRRVDGTLGWIFSRALPMLDADGEIIEWFGMASDITERKRLESSLREADRRKDEFLATLAHELRNPLAPIRNAVQLMKITEVTDLQMRTAREIVERQVHHMVRLVDDLLEVSRITLGQITLRRERVSVQNIVTHAVEAAMPLIESNNHALSVELPTEMLEVEGDATRLSQVFQNLLNNAAKYTGPGGKISVHSERAGDRVRVSVSDNGIGIPKPMQSRVFDLFTRVHPEDRIKTSGLGIGLSLAKQLVELHGGTLQLRSEGAGTGCEFIVSLPLRRRQAIQKVADTDATSTPPQGTRAGQRVLIVDDNSDAAATLAMLLQMEGHIVSTAADGQGAMDAFATFEPQVVLLDIGLPDLDGYEVARRMRATGTGKSVLLLAVTGWGQAEDKLRAVDAGFDAHLTKPVDSAFLHRLFDEKRRN